ncbi:hypothetical protein OUZ56_007669 [Daphnia magna]|uniref:Uncharacterized protein n=1 Tax=Daphnia magna TaxID=35525 RepID=A0ABR0AAM4_9CRUS|nr:hypothetical protein OUZ56_007669 [Daphnia magna]
MESNLPLIRKRVTALQCVELPLGSPYSPLKGYACRGEDVLNYLASEKAQKRKTKKKKMRSFALVAEFFIPSSKQHLAEEQQHKRNRSVSCEGKG